MRRSRARLAAAKYNFAFSRHEVPEVLQIALPPGSQRAQGRPGARCTRGLVCKSHKKCAHEHTGPAESIRPSLRNGFTAYAVISLATNSFVSPSPADQGLPKPGRAGVSPQAWHQQRMPGPHGFAVRFNIGRLRAADRSRAKPALPSRFMPDAAASTASHPASVTFAKRPLIGIGWDMYNSDLAKSAR